MIQGTAHRPADPTPHLAVPAAAAAATAGRTLTAALADADPPCAQPDRRDWWWSERPELAEAAAHHCRTCSVLTPCGAYADAAAEPAGIWVGRDRATPRRKARRDRATANPTPTIRRSP